ncbi:recombinase family protein [Candidatus Burkholderia verschuerenii]|uniref:recombinase family protein n=1 Tax=Candidatus Burkholderia verschuerenii TaxID=242163 RepID=UPI00067A8C3C|nr:recombinase family protein [Candidatus Burkholderia verschuerenii]
MSQLIGYARVSTADQNTALQLDALKVAGCEKIFIETASGARQGRPVLKEALAYAREGDAFIVYKLDRLARSLSQLISTVNDLKERKIEFRSLNEAIDTSTPAGRMTFAIFAALTEFERDVIRTRTKDGLAAARAKGKVGGRPKKLSEKDLAVARVLLSADPPLTFSEVARRLNVGPSTLYNYFPTNSRPGHKSYSDTPELPLEA